MIHSNKIMMPFCCLTVSVVLGTMVIQTLKSDVNPVSLSKEALLVRHDASEGRLWLPEAVTALSSTAATTTGKAEVISPKNFFSAPDQQRVISIGEELDPDAIFQTSNDIQEVMNVGEPLDIDAITSYAQYEGPMNIGSDLDVDSVFLEESAERLNIGADIDPESIYSTDDLREAFLDPINIGSDLQTPDRY